MLNISPGFIFFATDYQILNSVQSLRLVAFVFADTTPACRGTVYSMMSFRVPRSNRPDSFALANIK